MGISSKLALLVLLMVMVSTVTICYGGKVYEVGDSKGWTNKGGVDYKTWSSSKKFYVGDTILFNYSKDEIVLQVNHTDFRSCDTRFPIRNYTSGKNTIQLKRPHHLYFISDVYGDCMAGQKVDIRVLAPSPSSSSSSSSPIPSPSGSPPSSPVPPSASSGDEGSSIAPTPHVATAPTPSKATSIFSYDQGHMFSFCLAFGLFIAYFTY